MIALSDRAFIVMFEELLRWDPKFFQGGEWYWPESVIQPLSAFTHHRAEFIDTEVAKAQSLPIISKINFGGNLFLRPLVDYEEYKGRLLRVRPNHLIFSKINARRGCIFYSTKGHQEFVVSNEYPALKIDEHLASGEYVNLALRVGPAKETLFGTASGMAKPRTSLEEFQRIRIPLPPLPIQQAIVTHWQRAQEEAQALQERVAEREANVTNGFLHDLGLKPVTFVARPKAFAVWWKDIFQWSGRATFLLTQQAGLANCAYPLVSGRECLSEVRHGCGASPSGEPTTLEVLKISAVTRGQFQPSERKYMYDKPEYRQLFDLKTGDILMCRTNGTLAYVGMASMVTDQEDTQNLIFPDKVIRVRSKDNIMPEYLWYVLKSQSLRTQIEAAARTAVGNYAIGTEDIWNLQIPLPPLNAQAKIVQMVQEGRAEIAREREQTVTLLARARAEMEAMILGTMPPPITT